MLILDNYNLNSIPGDEQKSKITVIVACYNIETYIERCLRSIQQQTYRNLEILVTDDGSTDASGSICDRIAAEDPRIQVFHTDNHGLGPARNYAMDRASGEYLAFVDGDDYIEPGMYDKMYAAMQAFEDIDIVIARYREISADAAEVPAKAPSSESSVMTVMDAGELLKALVEENEMYCIRNCAWNKLYRRSLVEGSDASDRLRYPAQYYEDIVYTAKLLASVRKGVVLDDAFYNYVVDRSGSIMNQGVRWEILTQQIPSYMEKDEVLRQFGRPDLADIHDYMVYKKLLLLYTQARRSDDPERSSKMKALAKVIRQSADRFDVIYGTAVADPHQAMRMKLFLMSPCLYDLFMDVNDTFVIPWKQKRAKR